ncbi:MULTISPECIES: glutathione S-transferase family protein [Novosphingobium]|uniref:glutathione S-transferase family protein n=1 Tax=Novosphingobium sp. ST904 TaxID=1684385 RepID=UPI0006C8C185|nr:glutathione S-transferase family protein [Novosphingobium sp. ST904]KPH58700.1 glutathione S-transferase [Novosphingobium sp. ST904]TCM42181.1 glutathione S-transferase [Novosphingobium sp. ST904]
MTPEPVLELFGHPFSSYTWKALIALYAHDVPFVLQVVDAEHPEHAEVVQMAGPLGKFPVLRDGENLLFEATTIIEYIDRHHVAPGTLLPEDPDAATAIRMLDRVFDNYVMNVMQIVVNEYIRDPENPDLPRCTEARAQLDRVYAWLEGWLQFYPPMEHVTLIECAAAPALFYADWVHPIPEDRPRLRAWRAHLLSLPAVARCVDEARPFRAYFPLGAPDRD